MAARKGHGGPPRRQLDDHVLGLRVRAFRASAACCSKDYQVFGKDLGVMLKELNEVLVQ